MVQQDLRLPSFCLQACGYNMTVRLIAQIVVLAWGESQRDIEMVIQILEQVSSRTLPFGHLLFMLITAAQHSDIKTFMGMQL